MIPLPSRQTAAVLAASLVLPVLAPVAAHADSPVRQGSRDITLRTRAYQVVVGKSPFSISTRRAGRTVLDTTSTDALDFTGPNGRATPTSVRSVKWSHGALNLSVGTTDPNATLRVKITPRADRYQLESTVEGVKATSAGVNFAMASAGHWYGHGEAKSDAEGEPDTKQPWPLDAAQGKEQVNDKAFGPASYLMVEPFWYTQSATGVYLDSQELMHVSLGRTEAGVASMELPGGSVNATVFVEKTPHAVYDDYIGITGKPAKSDATAAQYQKPLFNSWAQFYSNVDQKGFLEYARQLHDAGVPAHTMQLDDGWMGHYGDFSWNSKFPDPKGMSDEIHKMGYQFGVWVTQWINLDADNYQVAKDKGYLLKSKTDPAQPCTVSWWNGKAGLIDLANPDAYKWYEDQLKALRSKYGVDGFKFDTRFYDESCATSGGKTARDYTALGAKLADEFDQQGVGIRVHWTGAQKYGFVTRTVDKGTDWSSLQAAVKQNLAVSTIGYPFVETDMIGGSDGMPPPTKQVLVRWAQAASVMPLTYASTSPIRVYDYVNKKWVTYDAETLALYKKAMNVHKALAPYIDQQVKRAVRTGEPIMKPLFFQFPKDQKAYEPYDEWLLGDSLLAAPVLSDGTVRDIHLPPGAWYDVARHKIVHGDLHGYRADLGTLPLFVRLGTRDTHALTKALR